MPLAIYISPTDVPALRHVPDELTAIRALVGGYIECVRLDSLAHAYVNEEGALPHALLPVNGIATAIAHDAGMRPDWPIRGPMVIFGSLDEDGRPDGDEHDVPGRWIKRLIPDSQAKVTTETQS